MDDEVAGARVERDRALRLIGDRAEAEIHGARENVVRKVGGDARVGSVDEAADRTRPIEQGCRPAHDLDPVRRERVDRDGMVGTRVRNIAHPDAVLEQVDPVAAQAPDDRSRGAAAEKGLVDARLIRQSLADRRLKFFLHFLSVENLDGLSDFA